MQLSSVTLSPNTTAFYQTTAINVGGNITSWGLLTANQSADGGVIRYEAQTSSTTNFLDTGWTSVVINSTFPLTVRPYIALRIYFNTISSAVISTINDVTVNWNEGESSITPFAKVFKDNYYLAYSTNTGATAANNKLLALERGQTFSFHNGCFAVGGLEEQSNNLLIADSSNTGRIYALETSTDGSDDNANVTSYIKFKIFTGDDINYKKILDRIYITITRDTVSRSQIFTVKYYIDNSTIPRSSQNIELTTGTYGGAFQVNIPATNPTKFKFLDIILQELTSLGQYKVHGIRGYGRLEDPD